MCQWFEILYSKLGEIFPEEAPSLIHGDLWSGNFLSDSKGNPVIFDPAVYYGHREMDIGMCLLFGGFSQDFYDAYNESFPLEKGWEERVPVTTLYPLLVHVLLFGASYAHQVKQLLRRLVGSMQ
jgi:fructosamine-3-kinase